MALSWAKLREGLDRLLAEVADARCVHCDFPVDRGALCAACAPVEPPAGPRCERCDGAVAVTLSRCGRCLDGFLAGLDRFRAASLYAGPYRTLLVRGKLSGVPAWIEATEPLVRAAARRGEGAVDAYVPVPSHPRRFAERGFNAAELVAHLLRRAQKGAPVLRLLERRKFEAPLSAGASRAARRLAVQGAFSVRSGVVVPPAVCLVDDVLTTGATLSACARVLRRAGATSVVGWTLLRAPDPFLRQS